MEKITDKTECCGCSACAQRCPKHCITMQPDEDGFLYPHTDISACADCGLCYQVCPIHKSKTEREPHRVFAAYNKDEIVRKESSSGGVFTMVAENIIQNGGVVFGARWSENWNVEHTYVETVDGLKAFRSSKYVQSDVNGCFQQVETFLRAGRRVLFSGTPCQVAGLKTFLLKEYDNLITVECVCHGVPSPKLWQKYIFEISSGNAIRSINLRDKRSGWRNYSVTFKFADGHEYTEFHDENPWIRAFIKNLSLRPSCYTCAFKCKASFADVTLGDLWGDRQLLPNQNEDIGISLVITHTSNGESVIGEMSSVLETSLHEVSRFNTALLTSSVVNKRRHELFERIENGEPFVGVVRSLTKDSLLKRLMARLS